MDGDRAEQNRRMLVDAALAAPLRRSVLEQFAVNIFHDSAPSELDWNRCVFTYSLGSVGGSCLAPLLVDGDMLVIDRRLQARSGDIVIVESEAMEQAGQSSGRAAEVDARQAEYTRAVETERLAAQDGRPHSGARDSAVRGTAEADSGGARR